MKQAQKGFAALEGLLILIIIAIIGGTGWYVWQAKASSNRSLLNAIDSSKVTFSSAKIKNFEDCKKSIASKILESNPEVCVTKNGQRFNQPIELSNATLKNSRLSFKFDSSIWDVTDNRSSVDPNCGKEDSVAIANVQDNFEIHFQLGVCGKGGGSCAAFPDCKAESDILATVNLSPTDTAYVVAIRTSEDNGNSWDYNLWLTDDKSCNNSICGFSPKNLSNSGTVDGGYITDEGIGNPPTAPSSLKDYTALPEVKAAVSLLSSLRYY